MLPPARLPGLALHRARRRVLNRGPSRVSPFYVPIMAPNMGACQVSMHLGLRGPALASVAACASGLYSYIEAKQMIDSGIAASKCQFGLELPGQGKVVPVCKVVLTRPSACAVPSVKFMVTFCPARTLPLWVRTTLPVNTIKLVGTR